MQKILKAIVSYNGFFLLPFNMKAKTILFAIAISLASCSDKETKTLVNQDVVSVKEQNLSEKIDLSAFGESIQIQLDSFQSMSWSIADSKVIEQFNLLQALQKDINRTPLQLEVDVQRLNEKYPFYSWECDDLFCTVNLDYGFLSSLTSMQEASIFKKFIALQCQYFPIDSIEYPLSSQYIIDGSNIYNNLGDFGYLNRLRSIDSLRASGVGEALFNGLWKDTAEALFSMENPFWYESEKILTELDSLNSMFWGEEQKAFRVELSVFRKRISNRAQEDQNYFNKRSGLRYE